MYLMPMASITRHDFLGDFMSPTINCLGSLLRMPYGCGEQNMINFAPAVYIRKYLVETDSLTPATEQKTRKIMSTGTCTQTKVENRIIWYTLNKYVEHV